MAATTDYYDERYVGIEELVARATAHGARRISVVSAEWLQSPRGETFQVTAEVETADGRVCRRLGRARPGDARVPDPLPPEQDDQVEGRAEKRAVASAIRTAYPGEEFDTPDDAQPPYVKRVQAVVRRAAAGMGLTRDELAEVAHRRYRVASLNDVTPEQADQIDAWLEPFVTGD